jgi:predicted nucleotidyltransferase
MKRELKQKLKKLEVSILYLFGSRAAGRGSGLSDVDIGVVLRDPPLERDSRDQYHALYTLFSEIFPASRLDIVFLQTAPLSLQYVAIKEGKILYEEDPKARADYEHLVINQYIDFRPILDFFDRVTMERYAKA